MNATDSPLTPEDLTSARALAEALFSELDDWTCPVCGSEVEFDYEGGVVLAFCPTVRWHEVDTGPVDALGDLGSLRVITQPVIDLNVPDHVHRLPDAIKALARYGTVYRHADGLATVEPDTGAIRQLSPTGLRSQLARTITWVKFEGDRRDAYVDRTEVAAPRDMGGLVLGSPDEWGPLPELDAVTRVPVLLPDGSLLTRPGYDVGSRTFYAPADGMRGIEPDMSADEAVALLDELFCDFPFVDESDRAASFGLLVLPFVRPAITGPTPLHWVDAPASRTGKSLLVTTCLTPALGRTEFIPWPAGNDKELAKKVTAALREGAQALNFDNVRSQVRSAVLEMALTADRWNDRVLGTSTTFSATNTQVWTLTANNGTFGGDLAGRVVPIRLDAGTETPGERDGFRHRLPDWARDNRPELARAALSLARAWVDAGMPEPDCTPQLGGFESWRHVVGGILETAGVKGLMANRTTFRTERDAEAAAIGNLFEAMHRESGGAWFTASGACEWGLPGTTGAQQLAENFLKPNKNRVVNGLRLERERRGGQSKWRTVLVSEAGA